MAAAPTTTTAKRKRGPKPAEEVFSWNRPVCLDVRFSHHLSVSQDWQPIVIVAATSAGGAEPEMEANGRVILETRTPFKNTAYTVRLVRCGKNPLLLL
jgi:hypothetical protein